MNDLIMPIITATVTITVVGIIVGILLSVASNKFKVEVNELEEKIREVLPGNNCGACGYPGCDGLAAAIVNKDAKSSACPVGGEEVTNSINELLGEEGETTTKKVAFVKCGGDCEVSPDLFEYIGPKDCIIASNSPNRGPKGCSFGCMGFGTCVKACPFGAIDIVNNIAVVNKEKCRACEICVGVCPRNIIEMVPYDSNHKVKCSSTDKGVTVKSYCKVGCIGCSICVKNCEFDAITVDSFLAHIDYEKCTNCGACSEKCPVKIITTIN